MDRIPDTLLIAAAAVGCILGGLLAWQLLAAISRLVLAAHTPEAVSLLLRRLSAAVAAGEPFDAALRGLRLQLAWPWPWRLARAADRIAAGADAADVLATSALLPKALRAQAAIALRQGPAAFTIWCDSVADPPPGSPLVARQQAFVLAELAAMLGVIHFIAILILPKFEQIFRDLGVPPTPLFGVIHWFMDWEPLVIAAVACLAGGWWLGTLALRWRNRRRIAAARLLLAGAGARLPEAAMGGGDFAALCAAAGWQADGPQELARTVARAEEAAAMRGAWLPAVLSTAAPVLAALPVAAMSVGILHLLIAILQHVEATS